MYCKKCGKKIEDDSNYCKYCGSQTEKKKDSYTIPIIIISIIMVLVVLTSIFIGKGIVDFIDTVDQNKPIITDKYYDDRYDGNDHHDRDYDDFFSQDDWYGTNPTSSVFTTIDITKFIELKQANTPSIIYIGKNSSTHCFQQTLYLYALARKYNITINYLNISNISDEDYQKLQSVDPYFTTRWSIPLMLLVQDDKIIDKKEGVQTASSLLEWIQSYGLIDSRN